MKIDRLRTLEQFIEFIDGLSYKELNEFYGFRAPAMMTYSRKYLAIVKYKDFLKQLLKKEMFVNEIEMPESLKGFYETHTEGMREEAKAREVWQEAEKKVIFDLDEVLISTGNHNVESILAMFKTVYELAEWVEGQLKLKSVEI